MRGSRGRVASRLLSRSMAGLVVLVVVALMSGCGAAGPTPSLEPSPAPERSPERSPAQSPERSPAPTPAGSLVVGSSLVVGGDRPVTVRVPPAADPAGAPLLIGLHGYSSNPSELAVYLGLARLAAERGIVTAYPGGTTDRQGNQFWNATDACCAFGGTDVPDAAYLAGLVDEIASRVPIDPRRVFVVGHSNGGFMSHRMACSYADRVAAIVSIAGATYADPADCAPSEPVAILEVHGTADDVIRYEGSSLADRGVPGAASYPGVSATAAAWLVHDGCDPALTESRKLIDVDAAIDGPDGPAETTVATSTGCEPGGYVATWSIAGGGHVPRLSATVPGALLDFLLAHPKP